MYCDDVTVKRNDEISLEETDNFTHFVLSPGPGLPATSGILMALSNRHAGRKPIFGICLGMQAIAQHYGGQLYNQAQVKHGIQTKVTKTSDCMIFNDLPITFNVGLYHSWAVEKQHLPQNLIISALSETGVIMGLEDRSNLICGVQFHPESILTEHGKEMVANWILYAKTSLS